MCIFKRRRKEKKVIEVEIDQKMAEAVQKPAAKNIVQTEPAAEFEKPQDPDNKDDKTDVNSLSH